jgi:peptidoglycan/xylan/chitin deacetylase (PgdA/CDA1 family)
MTHCTVLTYHSQNVHGHGTGDNDHVALREDLEKLHAAGFRFVPLAAAVDWLDGSPGPDPAGGVCLSFDDGCDFDVRDLEFPGFGPQRSFLGIMQDFLERHGPAAQPGLHATSFVIASSEARRRIDAGSLFGMGWMSDDWWRETNANPLLSLGNHGWDHFHPDLGGPGHHAASPADEQALCERQIVEAAGYIERVSGTRPDLFAYPFGRSSDYTRGTYFPAFREQHRCRAAFGTRPGAVTRSCNRWDLPRYVCGRDWKSPEELLALIGSPAP